MNDKKRLILDAECAQSKCARPTTGCWGECSLKLNPVVYANSTNIVAVYAVATQPAPIPANWISTLTDCAQLLDAIKMEWAAENAWSEWDQSVRDAITGCLIAAQGDSRQKHQGQPAHIPAQTGTQQASRNSALHAEPASQLDSFGSDADLIEWLDKLYCAEASGAVTNQKWPPAQYAIAALKQYALPAEPKKAVSSMDRAELQVEVFELRAQLAALVDPDYTLAPIEPTEAMVHAAEDIPAPRPFGKVYRAMLEAAPKADSLIAARGRAEGGNTCNEGISLLAGNALTDEALNLARKLIAASPLLVRDICYKGEPVGREFIAAIEAHITTTEKEPPCAQ